MMPDKVPSADLATQGNKEQSRSFHEQLIDSLYDGVYFVDAQRMITYWNRGAEELTGYAANEAVGKFCFDNFLNHVDDQGCNLCVGGCPLSATLADGKKREAEIYLQHKGGYRVPVSVRVSPIIDSQGAVVGAVEIFTDVSAKKRLERTAVTLGKMAYNDALTGIPNRLYTQLKVKEVIQQTRHFARGIGIIFIDLDHFKRVNDTYGHDLGDAVLRTVSRTLFNSLRPGDFIGRWGGEEFLAIAVDVSASQLAPLADRCRTLLARSPTQAGSSRIQVTASIGATLVRATDTPSSVVSRADKLMYRSKSLGRNRVTVA
jgi:diguanylate cyclase (GGDEF)-like protein/PAS domain S-box-containing protein